MSDAEPTFRDIIQAALKNPDADYKIRSSVYTVPQGERKQSRAIKAIKKARPQRDRHVIMGFAGLFTFDLAVAADPPPAGVLLCDANSNQAVFWEAFLPLIAECETAKELRERFSAFEDTADMRFSGEYARTIIKSLCNEDSTEEKARLKWIYSEKKYEKVRTMVLDGKVANITLDCLDEERYKLVNKTLADNNFSVSALYLSNILHFLSGADFFGRPLEHSTKKTSKIFWKNQLSLCDDETLIMEANSYPDSAFVIKVHTRREIEKKFLDREASK